jgi:hypothetical protein
MMFGDRVVFTEPNPYINQHRIYSRIKINLTYSRVVVYEYIIYEYRISLHKLSWELNEGGATSGWCYIGGWLY